MVATYYANKYAGKPTAWGQPYDPYGFTAAHPSLPFGTKLSVSYGDKSVIVTINPIVVNLDIQSVEWPEEIHWVDPTHPQP